MDKQKIANSLLNVQELPKNTALNGYIQKLMDEKLNIENKINWADTTAYTGPSTSADIQSVIVQASKFTLDNPNTFKEPKKQTKTDRIMEFFDPPEEKKPRQALFPDKTINDLMSIDPMMSRGQMRWVDTTKEDAIAKKLYDEWKISNTILKNYE